MIWRYWLVTPPNARLFKETVQRFELARKHATVGLFLTISALVVSSPVCACLWDYDTLHMGCSPN